LNDRDVLRRLAEGDAEAIRQLVAAHRDRMVAIARRTVPRLEDGEDVVHALILRWMKSPPRTARYTNLMGFLTIAIHNQAADWVEQQEKQRGRRPRSSGQTEEPTVQPPPKALFLIVEGVTVEELEDLLAEAKRDPSITRQDLLVLDTHFGQALSREQCAAELRIPVNRFDQQLHVAKKRLAAALTRAVEARAARTEGTAATVLRERKEPR
jgi:RNA polymerase sigma factor (sigma-70 family)